MTSPWASAYDAAGDKKLLLDPAAMTQINGALGPYQEALDTLKKDALDDTAAYFGQESNPLAVALGNAFNARGEMLKDYLTAQSSQTEHFVRTATEAGKAFQNAEQ
jgi:hypothetical protein